MIQGKNMIQIISFQIPVNLLFTGFFRTPMVLSTTYAMSYHNNNTFGLLKYLIKSVRYITSEYSKGPHFVCFVHLDRKTIENQLLG